ncbi:MAG: bifunctional hydroxymethylpyrimidine kinase/phosphomethylpyrimidine kinase, partial [Actinobacteria bacterium]|nr:bifunctional hydroxymethylpyrimidine kinase/phosphomethylpyrimidine kinase [Actinomycetota bacterium]NIS32540.1 bifunctional hydroxymethylpyrimidine kinase/phosphomethylpyrimidine kinase [Actinomycetota bacterium]NIT96304.1 bifunctional hydroxymethylpyrimidine kinase/phosphomethylpyrimidine kinase [Actinomycetota bacterium]NIU20025.1 bifunctional hydroxymethylpyrimidine kinase/phosphomethylpyrimidine kinase [Actinomycetota bacterium]NIU67558.1 bifunctional hydroxymethylpyrimidine kinase/phos
VADRVAEGALPPPVVDPVLVDGRGGVMFGPEVERAYRDRLIPAAAVVTPNLAEASLLIGRELSRVDDVVAAAEPLAALGAGLT